MIQARMLSDDAFVNVLAEVATDVTEESGIAWQGDKTLEKIKPEWKGSGETPDPARDAHPAKTRRRFSHGRPKMLSLALTPVQRPGIETPSGVNFGMVTGVTSVRIVVTSEVLQTIAEETSDKSRLLAKFELYRRPFLKQSPATSSITARKTRSTWPWLTP